MNAIFYQNESQKKLAEESLKAAAKSRGLEVSDVETKILPVAKFTYAEKYHQKYYLTRFPEIRDFLNETYADEKSFADSTVAMKLNAYLGKGVGKNWEQFRKELPSFGLPNELGKKLTEAVAKF